MDILKDIETGVYNKEVVKNQYGDNQTINKCNLFVDSVAQRYGVKLPRYPETSERPYHEGWEDRPASAYDMRNFLRGRTIHEDGGVRKIDRDEAHTIANAGGLVIVTSGGHSTIMAPGRKSPSVYRSDLAGRKGDKRKKVGVGKSYGDFYAIEPEQYNAFEAGGMRGNSYADITRYGDGIITAERKAANKDAITYDSVYNPNTGRYEDPMDPFGRP